MMQSGKRIREHASPESPDRERKRAKCFSDGASELDSAQDYDMEPRASTSAGSGTRVITAKSVYEKYFQYRNQDGVKDSVCLLCSSSASKVIGRKNGNTSGMKSHLKNHHVDVYKQLFPEENYSKQKTLEDCMKKEKKVSFDRLLACWMAHKYLPFNFFDDELSQKFFAWVNDQLNFPKRTLMHDKCTKEFLKMQGNFISILGRNDSLCSFTVDGWSSRCMKSYLGSTVHFIDKNFNKHSAAFDLVATRGKYSGRDLAKIFFGSIKLFNLQHKIGGLTLDNASNNSTFIEELAILLESENVSFNIEDQHFRCLAHVLNVGVQDVLKLLSATVEDELTVYGDYIECDTEDFLEDDEEIIDCDGGAFNAINKIRGLFKKVRKSESLSGKLEILCGVACIEFRKPIVDVKTRWNSTCDMIDVACAEISALDMLCRNDDELKKYQLSENEWEITQRILNFLELFKAVCAIASVEADTNLSTTVVAFNMLVDKIEETVQDLDNKVDRNSVDEKLLLAFQKGRDKLLKHYRTCNWIYIVSLILDPRHKVAGFETTQWGSQLKADAVKKFEGMYREKYYGRLHLDPTEYEHLESCREKDVLGMNSAYISTSVSDNWREEINRYIETPRVPRNTKVLGWWRKYSGSYPTLSRMARDILAISPSSVPVERLFSQAVSIVTDRRNFLGHESVRSMLCVHSWVGSSLREEICEI